MHFTKDQQISIQLTSVFAAFKISMASSFAKRCVVYIALLTTILMLQASGHTPPFTPLPSCQNKTPMAEASVMGPGKVPRPEPPKLTSTHAASGNSTTDGNGSQPVHNVEIKTFIFFGSILVIMLRILCA